VLETGGAKKVDSPHELKDQINEYLLNPQLNSKEREVLRKNLCYRLDGKSSERVVHILNTL